VVVSLDREGVVEAVRGDRAEVRLGKVGFQVATSDLRPIAGVEPGPIPVAVRAATPENDLDGGTPRELHLLGRTVDEAIDEIDRYLDRAVRTGWTEIRIIHGHGTGRLRNAVRAHLRTHPLASSHRAGGAGEGGDGATVVRLDRA
jgi:DNA mismatch repair protein MutS2